MKPILIPLALLSLAATLQAQSPRQRLRFDDGWRFQVEKEAARNDGSRFRWTARFADVNSLDVQTLPGDLDGGEWRPTKPGENVFAGNRRFAWLRADLGSKGGANQVLEFDGVDDNAVVFLNGRRMLLHRGWNEPFTVPVRSVWREDGSNAVVLLVENTGGGGGLSGGVDWRCPVLP